MDKYEFMSDIKNALEKIDNKTLLQKRKIIATIMLRMLTLEYEYAETGLREVNECREYE